MDAPLLDASGTAGRSCPRVPQKRHPRRQSLPCDPAQSRTAYREACLDAGDVQIAQGGRHDGLDGVHAVLSLLELAAVVGIEHLVGNFHLLHAEALGHIGGVLGLRIMEGRQAVQEDVVRVLHVRQQLGVHLVGRHELKFPKLDDTVNTVLKRIDLAISYAKKQGKNCTINYNETIGRILSRQIELERLMHKDITNGFAHFTAYYQPIFSSSEKKLVGCEALMRWNPPEFGQVSPAEFIPMAERLGYINLLGENMIRIAGRQCKKWADAGLDLRMNINLSVGQIIEPDFLDKIDALFDETGAPPEKICFEVTESLAIHDMEKMKELLRHITDKGVKIALDDFGTGYSSLNCIKEMPLNTIKIDKSFIDDIAKNPDTAVFVKMIVNLSHDLHIAVCAEGVEEQVQFDILRDLETDVIQGYYFGRPMPYDKFEEKFLSEKLQSVK